MLVWLLREACIQVLLVLVAYKQALQWWEQRKQDSEH